MAWLISLVFRRLERTADNIAGRLPGMIRQSGFIAVEQTEQHMTILGTLALYRGRKRHAPAASQPFDEHTVGKRADLCLRRLALLRRNDMVYDHTCEMQVTYWTGA